MSLEPIRRPGLAERAPSPYPTSGRPRGRIDRVSPDGSVGAGGDHACHGHRRGRSDTRNRDELECRHLERLVQRGPAQRHAERDRDHAQRVPDERDDVLDPDERQRQLRGRPQQCRKHGGEPRRAERPREHGLRRHDPEAQRHRPAGCELPSVRLQVPLRRVPGVRGLDQFNDAFIAEWNTSNWIDERQHDHGSEQLRLRPERQRDQHQHLGQHGDVARARRPAPPTTARPRSSPRPSRSRREPEASTSRSSTRVTTLYDSAVFLDNLVVGFVPDPANQCKAGAQVKTFNLTLTPPSAHEHGGNESHRHRDADRRTGARSPARQSSSRSPAPTRGRAQAITNAEGKATFTYTGTAAGDDTIVACYDADANATCGNAGDPIASRPTKKWVTAETTPPSCAITQTGTDAQGRKFIKVTTQDTGSGLKTIVVDKSTNSDTVVPAVHRRHQEPRRRHVDEDQPEPDLGRAADRH